MKHFFNAKGPEVNDTWVEAEKKTVSRFTGSFLKNFNGRPGDESQASDVSFVGNLFQPPTKNAISRQAKGRKLPWPHETQASQVFRFGKKTRSMSAEPPKRNIKH